jgi:hypothetical protein
VKRVVAAAAAVLILVVGAVWLVRADGEAGADPASDQAARAATSTTPVSPSAAPTAPSPSSKDSRCDEVDRAFAPRTISVPGVVGRARVVTPPRDANGVPGVPPLSSDGKAVFAWDRAQGIRPGDPQGNVLLNAHTWPDGTALGNRLLAGLERGDRIVLRGNGALLCYRVTERVEVSAERGLPRYYATDGPPQIAIVVCSGRRLGPGEWENRTVWFASPAA